MSPSSLDHPLFQEWLKENHEDAWVTLWTIIFRYAASLDPEAADDIAQCVAARLFKKIAEGRRYTESFSAVVFKATRREWLDRLRKKRRTPTVPLENHERSDIAAPVYSPLDVIVHPGVSAEQSLLDAEDQRAKEDLMRRRFVRRLAQWSTWIRRMRPLVRRYPASRAMLGKISDYLRALDAESMMLSATAGNDVLDELAHIELRLSVKYLNEYLKARKMTRVDIDNGWRRLKMRSADNHIPLPPGVEPWHPRGPRPPHPTIAHHAGCS